MTVTQKVTAAISAVLALSIAIWAAVRVQLLGSLLSSNYLAHRYCFLLQPGLVWTNAISDGAIWLSYLAIAFGLAMLLRRTERLLAFRWVFVAFGLFIVACGFTHFFEMVTVWTPLYWLSTTVKIVTAAASIVTAIGFVPLVPRAASAIRLFNEAYSHSEQQRVKTLSRLLDTEERMKLAMESSGFATWERNLATGELYWDERCRAVFGVPPNRKLRYEDFLDRIHPDERARTQTLIETSLRERNEYNATFRIVRDSGEVRTVISRGKVFGDDQARPVRLVGILIDVTRERQAEEALVKAEKLAVAGRMAASIAHEINNPLAAASALLYTCRTDEDVPEHLRERLQLVENELHRAGQITRSTLTFYRESPDPVPTNPAEIIESVLSFYQSRIRRSGVEVQTDLAYSEPVLAFPGELRQVFINLISNAIDAMPEGGKLVVRVYPSKHWGNGQNGYRILLSDNGAGVPPESSRRLFEPFYTTKGDRGTGLGLWITHQLVKKHGGYIKFRSEYGRLKQKSGTVFVVWLPLAHDFSNVIEAESERKQEDNPREV